jgi:hypothetical protein
VTREELARTADEAAAAAQRIGYPVALKIQSPELMHKSDAGGLVLGLNDETSVRSAYAKLASLAAKLPTFDGVLVQEMVEDGVEFLIGMHRDPILGPVVVLSPGGVFVELFENASVMRLPPFDAAEAEAMVRRSRTAENLLAGFRGRPPADRGALIKLLADFAALVERLDERVAAIDLNPVMVLPDGGGAKIVDAGLELALKRS